MNRIGYVINVEGVDPFIMYLTCTVHKEMFFFLLAGLEKRGKGLDINSMITCDGLGEMAQID